MKSVNFGIGKPHLRYFLAVVLAALYLLGYFYPEELWFASSVVESPLLLQIIYWAAFCLLLFEEVLAFVDKALGWIGKFLFETLKSPPRAILLILFGAVFIYVFRARHFIWGDSHVIVRYVEEFSTRGSNVARRYFVILFYWIFTKAFSPLGFSTYTSLMIVHSFLGGIFLWVSAEFSRILAKRLRQQAAIFLVISTSSLFLLFSHIELYAPGVVCAIWFMTVFLKNLHNKGFSRYNFIFPLALAIIFQPLYIYLLVLVPMIAIRRVDKRIIALGVIIIAVGILCFIGSGLDEVTRRACLPMSFPDYFWSWQHILLLVNLLLFTSPAVLILLTKFEKKPGELVQYLSGLAITSIVLVIPLFLELGALDWNLVSALLFPIILISGYRTARAKPYLRAFIVGVSLLICCTESYLNVDNYYGERRAENVLLRQDTPYYRYNRSPLDRLVMTNIYQPEAFWSAHKVHRWGDKLIEYEPQHPRPYLYQMSFNLWNDRPDWAAYYAFEAIHSGKVGKDMIPRLMRFFEESIVREVPTMEEVERMYADGGPFSLEPQLIEELRELAFTDKMPSPDRERSMEEILRICLYMNQMAVAGHFEVVDAVYTAAKKLYPGSGNIELIYGAILLMAKRPAEANNALRRSFILRADIGSIFSNMGLVCAMLGDVDKGLAVVEEAIKVRPWLASYRCNYSLLLSSKFGPDSAINYLDNYSKIAVRNGFASEANVAREFMQTFINRQSSPNFPSPDTIND